MSWICKNHRSPLIIPDGQVCDVCGQPNPAAPAQTQSTPPAIIFPQSTSPAPAQPAQPAQPPIPAGPLLPAFTKAARVKIKGNQLQMIVLWLLATIVGLFGWYGVSFAIFAYSFYLLMPGEYSIMAYARSRAGIHGYKCPIPGCTTASLAAGGCVQHHTNLVPIMNVNIPKNQRLLLFLRSGLKITMIIALLVEFIIIHNISTLIPVVITLFAYFSMPTKYKTTQPYKAIEGWIRPVFGIFLALIMANFLTPNASFLSLFSTNVFWMNLLLFGILLLTGFLISRFVTKRVNFIWFITMAIFLIALITGFSTYFGAGNNPEISIFYLILAFFVTMPERIKVETERVAPLINLQVAQKDLDKALDTFYKIREGKLIYWRNYGDIIFLVLSLVAAAPMILDWTYSAGETTKLTFILTAVWVLSILIGWAAGREGRPYIGLLVLFMSLIVFSFQFTGTVGTATFGAWWPSVYAASQGFIEPLSAAADAARETMADATLFATCPNCYYAKQQSKQDIGSGISRGSTKSVEVVDFEEILQGTPAPTLDPQIPLIFTMELANKGEFTAKNLRVQVNALNTINPENVSAAEKGYELTSVNGACVFTSCSGIDLAGRESSCLWSDEFLPDDARLLTFECGDEEQAQTEFTGWASDMYSCTCNYCTEINEKSGRCTELAQQDNYDCTARDQCRACADVDDGSLLGNCEESDDAVITYTKGSWLVDLDIDYTFEYSVNTSLDVTIMDKDTFLKEGITPKTEISQYSGGPAKVTLWTQKQPLRADEEGYGRFSISNTGTGKIKKGAELWINIPIPKGMILSKTPTKVTATGIDCYDTINTTMQTSAEVLLLCKLDDNLEKDESATYFFRFKYSITDDNLEEKTVTFTGGILSYEYTGEHRVQMPVKQAPPQ